MQLVFIDPEPPDAAGGGIRTYIRLALDLCRKQGMTGKVYTHNPSAYSGETALPIGRRAWLRSPFRGLAYRLFYGENVMWEHAYWLERELAAADAPDRVYEFCDFQGYAFFALRNRALRPRCQVRIHTPAFLVPHAPVTGLRARLSDRLSEWRERDCLARAPFLAAPSAEFVRERMPWLRGWEHVPNPLPYEMAIPDLVEPLRSARAAALARTEAVATPTLRPPPPNTGSGWSAAPADPAEARERARALSVPASILPTRFLYLGRVEERKGVLVLVRAFLRLAEERPFASLTLVGGSASGPYAQAVKEALASQAPGIRARLAWEAPCAPEARPALFARFTALAVPSLWENSPYVYFEAMSAGLSCIGSATGEMKAVAQATGALAPRPGDEDDWLKALRAHCDGLDARVPAAQTAWLRQRRLEIPERLMAAWRKSRGTASAPESR